METIIQFSVLLLALQLMILCSCKDNITMNQTFKEGDLLVSKQNSFALGFFSPEKSNKRYLGIWFNKVPEQTVVWVANRNTPMSRSSSRILSINQQGNLVLFDDDISNPVWSTNVSVEATDSLSAQLLDNGNLVLVLGRKILWQSFDYPTDTLIQGMKLGLNWVSGMNWFLTSSKSVGDPSTGDYSFKLNPSGLSEICIYNRTEHCYSRPGPWPFKTYNGFLQQSFVNNKNEIYYTYSIEDASFITRFVLDDTGLFQLLIWHQEHNQWNVFWSSYRDRCDLYEHCGANSKCDSNVYNKFECNCLPGYEPKSPKDWNLRDGSSGCIKKRSNSTPVCGHGEGFMEVESVKIPDSSVAGVWVDMSTNRKECERICKSNCSCSAYASRSISENGSGCLTWSGELIDTINLLGGVGFDLYVRVDALELAASGRRSRSLLEKKGMLILYAVSAWFVLIIIFIYFWLRMRKKKGTRSMNKHGNKRSFDPISGSKYYEELEGGNGSNPDLRRLNLNTILAATDDFSPSNKIGQGGFGTVYKGQLANGQEIAVKRMSKTSRQGIEEFKNEATLIAKLQHRNLVKLVGCCIHRKEQILVYEYMPNGSLDSFIFGQAKKSLLDWEKRFDIIVGIARGILYLHQDSRLRIIHRDLKTSNILLDAKMTPKISDFGMATILKNDEIQGKTNRIVGTYGYMSPEYVMFGKFSVKSDVFSFGVILLEIICGMKNKNFSQGDPSLSLTGQVWRLWNGGKALEIVDTLLMESFNPHEAMRCIQVGLLCVQEDAMDRPTMLEVVLMLKSETPLPSPKQPAFICGTSSNNCKSPTVEEILCSINEVTITEVKTR